ncbi:UNVERIFIED_CONTAM: hypothetical protein FKN15_025204 [Acipenser sinensis]
MAVIQRNGKGETTRKIADFTKSTVWAIIEKHRIRTTATSSRGGRLAVCPRPCYTPHRCKLRTVPGCVTASSPDKDTQLSTLVLCPRYLVLSALAPQSLGLDACGTLKSSVPQNLRALVLLCPRCTKALKPWCLGALDVQVLLDIGDFVPWCSIASVPQCFVTLGVSRTIPSVLSCLEGFLSPVHHCPQCLSTSVLQHPQCLKDSMPRSFDAFEAFVPQYLQDPRVPGAP